MIEKESDILPRDFEIFYRSIDPRAEVLWKGEDYFFVSNPGRESLLSIEKKLANNHKVVDVSPVYLIDDKLQIGVTSDVILLPKDSSYDMSFLCNKYGLKLSEECKVYKLYSLPKGMDVFEISNALYETGDFVFAHPNLIGSVFFDSYTPNDPYYQYQVALNNIGQLFNGHTGMPDADIDAPEAWDITKGSSDIVVAVIDQGVTSNHPDLPNSRQFRIWGSNYGPGNVNDPSPTGNRNHGNACAGIIAATMDNHEGITGIAPECVIMPIRCDSTPYLRYFAHAIQLAADSGANVISCSWSLNVESPVLEEVIYSIQYAISKNVNVVFAAGNTGDHLGETGDFYDLGYVCFPANVDIPYLLTIGASDRYDRTACYSPISSKIDLVAPSHRAYPFQISGETLEMWSIDIPGAKGYNPSSLERSDVVPVGEEIPSVGTNYLSYTGRFGGTSFACPVVAGVIALMLSVKPSLTPSEVFDILTSTADKVGGYTYVDGRCDEMGFGRVNAHNAVLLTKYKFIQDTIYTDVSTEEGEKIYAGYAVTNTKNYGEVLLEAGSEVTFRATNGIHLLPGFHAKPGSFFWASIESDNNRFTRSVDLSSDERMFIPSKEMKEEERIEVFDTIPIGETNTIYPNPTKGKVFLNVSGEITCVKVYNTKGQCVIQTKSTEIDFSDLSAGLYYIHAIGENTIFRGKIIHM